MPSRLTSTRFIAYGEAATLPVIFGSTVVLAKLALADVGPLTLAAFRFALAALVLLPIELRRGSVTGWPPNLWLRLAVMGIAFYVIGNGSLFVGLKFIPATTAALLLSLTPLLVLVIGVLWLGEVPSPVQLIAVACCVGGSLVFFSPGLRAGEPLGIAIIAAGLLGSAAFTVMGRDLARRQVVDTMSLTTVPLALGAAVLLPIALVVEGLPRFSLAGGSIVVVLALLNTVGAFLIYNHLLRALTALELTTVLNLNPLVTAGLASFILGTRLSPIQLLGMLVVVVSVVAVQIGSPRRGIVN